MEKIKKIIKLSKSDVYIQIFLQQSNYNIGTFTDVPFLFDDIERRENLFNKFVRIPHRKLSSFRYGQIYKSIEAYGESELNNFYRYGNVESYTERFIKKQAQINNLQFTSPTEITVKDVFIARRVFFEELYESEGVDAPESEIIEDIDVIPTSTNIPNKYYEYRYGIGINDENSEFPIQGITYTETETENGKEVVARYTSQGYNYTNSSIYANIKEEHLLGISEKHDTESNIDIDRRNGINVFEIIQKLGEINNVEHLSHYNNGEFNIIK